MTSSEVIDLGKETLWVMLQLAGPLMITALVIGVVVSFFQALTQIQESTIAFVPKIMGTFVVMFFLLSFFGAVMDQYSQALFDRLVVISTS